MATQAATLTVKIAAEIKDFSANIKKAQKDFVDVAEAIGKAGEKLTLGVTLPFAAAVAELTKMGAENERIGNRMTRVFGDMSESINASIKGMMKSVPETETDLQKMAIALDNMLQGMELGSQRAAQMSPVLLKLAADMAAFAGVPMEDALSALERGLSGSTKGLREFGISFNQSELQQEAYRLGLLHSGNALTSTGTALAAYSLILQHSNTIQGEAARVAGEQGASIAFLKRDFLELADSLSNLVLPAVTVVTRALRDFVDTLALIPPWVDKLLLGLTALVAIIGPLASLVSGVMKMIAAFRAAAGIGGVIAALADLPFTAILAGLAAIAAAVYGIVKAYQYLKGTSPAAAPPAPKAPPTITDLLHMTGGGGGATDINPKTPLQQFKDYAANLKDAFNEAVKHGQPLVALADRIAALNAKAARDAVSNNPYSEWAKTARGVRDETQDILDLLAIAQSKDMTAAAKQVARQRLTPTEMRVNQAKGLRDEATSLQQRLYNLANPQTYDVQRNAKAQAGEARLDFIHETAVKFQELTDAIGTFKHPLMSTADALTTGLKSAALAAADALAALIQNLAQRLAGGGPGAQFGSAIGGALGGAFIGSKYGLALGPLGAAAGALGGALLGGAFDSIFGSHKKSVDNNTYALDRSTSAVRDLTERLSNAPAGFKVDLLRYHATEGATSPPGGTGGGAGGGAGGPGIYEPPSNPHQPPDGGKNASITISGPVTINGVTDFDTFVRRLGEHVERHVTPRGGTSALRLALT